MTPSWHCINLERCKVFALFIYVSSPSYVKKKVALGGWYISVWTKHIQKGTRNFLMKYAIHCQFTWVKRIGRTVRGFLSMLFPFLLALDRSKRHKSWIHMSIFSEQVGCSTRRVQAPMFRIYLHKSCASNFGNTAQVAPRLCQAFGRCPAGKLQGTSGQVTL